METNRPRDIGLRWLGVVVAVAAAAGLARWPQPAGDPALALQKAADQSRKSVFLVVVEYGLRKGNSVPFRRIGSGTAFLTRGGRLVSNRHVFCPWTSEEAYEELREAWDRQKLWNGKPAFFSRIWVLRDGMPAYRKSVRLGLALNATTLEDLFLPPLWRTDGPAPTLRLLGVQTQSASRDESLLSDVGVLQVVPPDRCRDLPALVLEAAVAPPMTPVAAVGFPMAGRMENRLANAAICRGEIRRWSRERGAEVSLLCYEGNSGSPILDSRGRVVAMATANLRESGLFGLFTTADHQLTLATPAGQVQQFLADLDARRPAWDGFKDPGFADQMSEAMRLVSEGRYAEAHAAFYWGIEGRTDPQFLLHDAIFRHLRGDTAGAISQCERALATTPDSHYARFLLVILRSQTQRAGWEPLARPLSSLDWRAEGGGEFYGYATRWLVSRSRIPSAVWEAGESRRERTWLQVIGAMNLLHANRLDEASRLLLDAWREADLTQPDTLLLQRELDQLERQRRISADWRRQRKARYQQDLQLAGRIESLLESLPDNPRLGQSLSRVDRLNAPACQVAQCFAWAGQGQWAKARINTQAFLARPHRPGSANALGMALLDCQFLRFQSPLQSTNALRKLLPQIPSRHWYARIIRALLGQGETGLEAEADMDDCHLVTLHTALGLQAEADNDHETALRHYLQAVSSRKQTFLEFRLATQRIQHLAPESP